MRKGGISTLGYTILDARVKKDISLREASAAIGISIMYLCEIENDKKTPKAGKTLENIARFYEMDYEYLKDIARMTRNGLLTREQSPAGEKEFLVARDILNGKISVENFLRKNKEEN